MKGLINPMPRALPVCKISLFVIVFLFSYCKTIAQNNCNEKTYEVLNDIFGSGLGEARIYETTLFGKGWANYFEDYEKIFGRVGIPTSITDAEFKEILDEEAMRKINSAILAIRPCKLSSKSLNDKINLSEKFDSPKAIAKGTFRVSQPIFVGNDIAILKKESIYEAPIFILQKANNRWEIIYTFYDWVILED